MRIKILSFCVTESYVLRSNGNIFLEFFNIMFNRQHNLQYHFDASIKVDPAYEAMARPLAKDDFVQLPNGVRLLVYSVDRLNMVRAKTIKMIETDLRKYTPMEMYLVYPRVHGRISDRAI